MAAKREGGGVISKVLELLGMGAEIFSQVGRSAERRASAFAAKLGLRLLLQFWISAGLFLALIGLFDLLIDSAGVPRGLVYSVGGGLIALFSLLLLRFAGKGLLGGDTN